MSSATLYRASGLALLLGAVLSSVGFTLGTLLAPDNDPHQLLSPLWLPEQLMSFLGEALLLLGLPAIYARQATRAGRLGFVGFILTFLGGFLLASTSIVPLLILPWLAQASPKLAAQLGAGNLPPVLFLYFPFAGLLFMTGAIMLSIATIRAAILPRWASILCLAGVVLNLVVVPIFSLLAFVVLALGLGWIGYVFWSAKGEALSQPELTPEVIATPADTSLAGEQKP